MDHTEAELESFRQQWRKEVTAKTRPQVPAPAKPEASSNATQNQKKSKAPAAQAAQPDDDEGSDTGPETYHGPEDREPVRRVGDLGPALASSSKQPASALEHYEKAVEKETQGSLGDSVSLYRKAFRLDEKVHERYKIKHFPPSAFPSKPTNINPSNAPVTVPNPAHHSFHGPSTLSDLVEEFSQLAIQGQEPPTDLSPPPPCPIASVPEEILVEILLYTAISDVASLVRLAQVCKRLAYLVLTEDRIWRRICLGHEFGFGAMHYRYACTIRGEPLLADGLGGQILGTSDSALDIDPDPDLNLDTDVSAALTAATAATLIPRPYQTYRRMFHSRPRIRFNGCYISTVNYTRPGASSSTQLTWNSPVLIVTYYRYLRFFRDGTVISLLTTAEPADVVHHLLKEHVGREHGGNLPSAVMRDALPGRWRLSGPASRKPSGTSEDGEGEKEEEEGMLHIETEGVTPKYLYKMQLQVGSAGRGARNNKLTWRGYWSYNRLTDDWGEFGLRNDRAFYWSRVRSYGMGL
ncbi:hypothetical protein H2201_003862 [Coniosporium apollinis]|uniref:F-box domain-containing protein n=2 Tax=Coniosporium TaxID=2810619 RepID=A0ABQ9NW93_9PEZI|nr:hypothetical protein H2199_002249 [Cladosporium sp. JES 115]KAJ9665951.1 hypothetical protein H2201_003862 [Coniosporium apollinis]